MEPLELLQRLVYLFVVVVLALEFVPIVRACKASLLEDLARRKKEREERKKNG